MSEGLYTLTYAYRPPDITYLKVHVFMNIIMKLDKSNMKTILVRRLTVSLRGKKVHKVLFIFLHFCTRSVKLLLVAL